MSSAYVVSSFMHLDCCFVGNSERITGRDKEDVNSKKDIARKPLEDKHFTSSITRQPDAERE